MRMSRHLALDYAGGFKSTDFTFTGIYTWIDDGNKNFRIKFLTSGTFTPKKRIVIDVCMVGGGGGTVYPNDNWLYGCGGGGYTNTVISITLEANTSYGVIIGAGGGNWANGGATWFNNVSANGGLCGSQYPAHQADVTLGGAGGSGGNGLDSSGWNGVAGYTGENGDDGSYFAYGQYWCWGGGGQHRTTREFGETSGTLYSKGGNYNTPTVANTGNGAVHCYGDRNGCSGICVIRNHRAA